MTEDDLPPDTGDHRPVTQRALRQVSHLTGKEMGAQLKARDARISKLETAVSLLPAFAQGGLVATNEAGAPESFYPS